MSISKKDIKILWGRVAGICSNPDCRVDLTHILEDENYNVGEMAHVIAKKELGPRGVEGGGEDIYSNLILLCPTCHEHIDKSPEGTYSVEKLLGWKLETESLVRKLIENVARNDPYKLFEVANNSLSYRESIVYFTKIRLRFCEQTDARLYQMITRVQFHLDSLNISSEDRETITRICGEIKDKSDTGFERFSEFERLAMRLADKCYAALVDPFDRAVFNFSRSYVDLFRSLVTNEFTQQYREDFEYSYNKLFDNKDDELNRVLDDMQTSIRGEPLEDRSLEPKVFKRIKFMLYNGCKSIKT